MESYLDALPEYSNKYIISLEGISEDHFRKNSYQILILDEINSLITFL